MLALALLFTLGSCNIGTIKKPVWTQKIEVIPNTTVHYVFLYGVVGDGSGNVITGGIGVNNNFLVKYDKTGKEVKTRVWPKGGSEYTTQLEGISKSKSGVFTTGISLLRRIDTNTLEYNWEAKLPYIGNCAVEDMKIDDVVESVKDKSLFIIGSCQPQKLTPIIFLDEYDIATGNQKMRQQWPVTDFISDCDPKIVINTNLAKHPTNETFYVGVKCQKTSVRGWAWTQKQWVGTQITSDSSDYLQPKRFVATDADANVYVLTAKELSKYGTVAKSNGGIAAKATWNANILVASQSNLSGYSMDLDDDGKYASVVTSGSENLGVDTYLARYDASKGTRADYYMITNQVTPSGAVTVTDVDVSGNNTYVIVFDKTTGFPVGGVYAFDTSS